MTQMFRSATFRLTVWYLAIVTVINLMFSIVVYRFAVSELQSGLVHQTQRIYENFPVFTGNPLLRDSDDLTLGSHHILWRLIYFNLLVLIFVGIASYYLARRTLRPIEAAHKRQQRFTADVSHELRTPLTSLKMSTEVALLDKSASKPALRQALESNLEDVGKMELLINSLLRLTRLDADAIQASFGPLQAATVVQAASSQVSTIAASKQIRIVKKGKDQPLFGDEATLTQLLVILLDNAIKYSTPGSHIQLETKADGDSTLLIIHDSGQGMAPDVLPHVFDRFYRADASRNTTTTEGFGLGLSIAKLISDMHHGTITITSRLHHGTTVTVRLPQQAMASVEVTPGTLA
jgi:signal transduction histidine kinase